MNHVEKAKQVIRKTLLTRRPCINPCSFGKDSSAVLNLTVTVAAEIIAEMGKDAIAPISVVNADTLIENPEIERLLKTSVRSLKDYCAKHDVPLDFYQSKPALASEWMVTILSGRNLPVYANRPNRDCSVNLKIQPMERLKKKLLKHLEQSYGKPITCVGTRFSESKSRKARMEARGESAEAVWENDTSGDMLSPIANWSEQDVWQYLDAVTLGQEEGFTGFEDLERLYRDGSDQSQASCGEEVKSCRFGCTTCVVTVDRSMANLLKNDPARYGYMAGIHKLQNYLLAIQWDLNKRQWIGRTINEHGYIGVYPDTFSSDELERLFLMILTLVAREEEEAYRLGIAPRFKLLSHRAIIAIDALWSQQGVHKPFHGLYLYKRVFHEGYRLDVPEIEPAKRVPIPEKRYLYVGEGWHEDQLYRYSGMRDIALEMTTDPDSFTGCGATEQLKDGRTVQKVEYSEDGLFDVDEEGAEFILGFELDYLLEKYHNDNHHNTFGYTTYLSMGTLELSSKRQAGTSDMILRRTAHREHHGLIGPTFDLQKVIGRTISKKEMLAAVAEKQGEVIPIPVPETQEETQQPQQLDLFQECA